MKKEWLEKILNDVSEARLGADEALEEIWLKANSDSQQIDHNSNLGYVDLGFAKVDLNRKARNGFPEVIFGEGKNSKQIIDISNILLNAGNNVLATRISKDKAIEVINNIPKFTYHEEAACLTFCRYEPEYIGNVAILTAGTSDYKVAEEAAVVADFFGLKVNRYYDVGVAGIHRLFSYIDSIRENDVVICVAGMEGALVSVIGGLVDSPLLAVPSGVGYGAGADGITTLLSMLNSCASGLAVLNIGNGFGAAYMAATICKKIHSKINKIN